METAAILSLEFAGEAIYVFTVEGGTGFAQGYAVHSLSVLKPSAVILLPVLQRKYLCNTCEDMLKQKEITSKPHEQYYTQEDITE